MKLVCLDCDWIRHSIVEINIIFVGVIGFLRRFIVVIGAIVALVIDVAFGILVVIVGAIENSVGGPPFSIGGTVGGPLQKPVFSATVGEFRFSARSKDFETVPTTGRRCIFQGKLYS